MPVHRHGHALGATQDFEPALLHPRRARETVGTIGIEKEQYFLSLSVSGSIMLIANVPNELPETEKWSSCAFESLRYAQGHNYRCEVLQLWMRLDPDADYLTMNNRFCLLRQVSDVARCGESTTLGESSKTKNN